MNFIIFILKNYLWFYDILLYFFVYLFKLFFFIFNKKEFKRKLLWSVVHSLWIMDLPIIVFV